MFVPVPFVSFEEVRSTAEVQSSSLSLRVSIVYEPGSKLKLEL
jgi:hypothetical protein